MKPISYPTVRQNLTLHVDGIFATPEDWKTTDEANPSLFTYTIRFLTLQLEKGKIQPRQMTPKELREQEEKGKKGGKKETKKEESTGEDQRLKQEEEDQRRREEEWNKLPQRDQKYRDYEDPFRSASLKFQNNLKSEVLTGKSLVIFQQRVSHDNGQWLYLIKSPNASQEELAKLRKAKPKTLGNINDLNPVVMRCWVDLSTLCSKEKNKTIQRCSLIQVDKTPDTPEPNLEKTYLKIRISLDQPFLKKADGVIGNQLIASPPIVEAVSERVKVVEDLEGQLRLGIESLAMEFSAMFWKELNIYEDFKNINFFANKKNDVMKRKEHFLYDFNVSGKYKILKDRLKKVIVYLCEKYYTQQIGNAKSFTGVSCTLKDQFYSEIYMFLVTKYKQILQQLIFEKKENLLEVQVLSHSAQKKNTERYLAGTFKETTMQTVERVTEEYTVLADFKYGEKIYKIFSENDPSNPELKYHYAIYCIKNKLKRPEQVLSFIEEYLSYNKDDLKVRLEYLLILVASETQDNCKKAWVLLRELIESNPNNITNLMIASLLFGDLLNNQELANKYLYSAARNTLKKKGTLPQDGKHKDSSNVTELPSIKGLPTYSQALGVEEQDKLWIEVLSFFLNLNLVNIVAKIQTKIKSTKTAIFDVLNLQKLHSEGKFEQFESLSKELYGKIKAQQILDLLVAHLLQHPNADTANYLKINLVKTTGEKQLQALLKLAFYYVKQQQYANAKSCLLKYLEKKPINSGCSWRMLGLCELKLVNLSEALACLTKANVYDINNSENWILLAGIYARQGKFIMCNQCLNQYESMLGNKCREDVAKSITDYLSEGQATFLCEQKMRTQLRERLTLQEVN